MEAAGLRYILHPSRSDQLRIWGVADLHLGNRGVNKDLLARDLKEIKDDPNSFWVGVGDYAEYITITDRKRFDAEALDPDILGVADLMNLGKVLTDAVVKTFAPIKHKCLGLAFGNHEGRYMREQDQTDLHAVLCDRLGVPNLRYSAMFTVVPLRVPGKASRLVSFEKTRDSKGQTHHCDESKTFFVHHGAGGAQTAGGKQNRLRRFMRLTDADATFVGHCHDTRFEPETILRLDRNGTHIGARKRLGLMTGSYLTTYTPGMSGYGERAGYEPATLGAVWVQWSTETGELRSEVRT